MSSVALLTSILIAAYVLLRMPTGKGFLALLLFSTSTLIFNTAILGLAAPAVFLSLYFFLGSLLAYIYCGDENENTVVSRYLLWPIVLSILIPFIVLWCKGQAKSLGGGGLSTLHLWLVTAAVAAAAMAAGAGFALTLQDYCLKAKKPLPSYMAVPSLAEADKAVYRLAGLTFALLTVSIIIASTTVGRAWGAWRWEPRTLGALLLWLLYGLGLHMRRIAGWRGARLGGVVLTGFALLIMTLIIVLLKVVL